MEQIQNKSDNDISKTNFSSSGRKITKNDIFLKEAKNIIKNFIYNDSKFEVNISDKVKKRIIYDFKEIKSNELQQQEFKNRLKVLFDEAYKEVIDSLFLNSYTNYILKKKQSKKI